MDRNAINTMGNNSLAKRRVLISYKRRVLLMGRTWTWLANWKMEINNIPIAGGWVCFKEEHKEWIKCHCSSSYIKNHKSGTCQREIPVIERIKGKSIEARRMLQISIESWQNWNWISTVKQQFSVRFLDRSSVGVGMRPKIKQSSGDSVCKDIICSLDANLRTC